MKRIVSPGEYTFDASAKTITFSDTSIALEHILRIVNVKRRIVIYESDIVSRASFFGVGGSFAASVLTLDYDTTRFNDTDELQIFLIDDMAGTISIGASSSAVIPQIDSVAKVSVTDTAQDVTLTTGDQIAAEIHNVGSEIVYLRDTGDDADTDDYELGAWEKIYLKGSVSVVCASGKTSTIKILKVKA